MHEMSLCENILGILKEQALAQNFETVKRVSVEIGSLSCVEPEALRFGFDVVMRGSLAEDATLEIIETEALAECLDCGATSAIAERYDPCPMCGSHRRKVTRGEEFRIRELEVN